MKTTHTKAAQNGSALLVTIVITGVLTLAMAGYLMLISTQYRSTVRSKEWNGTIPITEAGVEEALSHLNKNCLTNGINVNPFNPEADFWQSAGGNKYSKTRVLDDGSTYTVTVDLTDIGRPTIYSQGYSVAPLSSRNPSSFFAALGSTTESSRTKKYLNRNVRVTTRILPVFNHALAAEKGITMNGNGVTTDSFNSTNGPYSSTSKMGNGDVATNSNLDNDLNTGNADINGHISNGPGGQVPEIGPNGAVGSIDFVNDSANNGKIESGHWNNDMNVEFEEVEVPFESGGTPTSPYTASIPSTTSITNIIGTCDCTGGNNCCSPAGIGGTIVPKLAQVTTAGMPSSGSYVGAIVEKWTPETSTSTPSGNVRDVKPDTTPMVSAPYTPPTSGYYGEIIEKVELVNYGNTKPTRYEPGLEPYKDRGKWYANAKVYHYQKLNGYKFERLTGYTYASITGYNRELVVTTTITNSETYAYAFLSSGNYKVSSLSGKIYVSGNAVVYCTGTFSADKLYIAPGGSLQLYVGGDISFAGNQKANEGGYAKNLSVYGLPTCKNISFSGNAEFTGTIYAPQATLAINGGGNDTKDFFGAIICGSATLGGHSNFHYDEDLKNSGPSRGYIANSWREEAPDTTP